MMPVARELSRNSIVYVPDQPGFGGSGHPEQVLDMAGLADALAGWMRAAGLPRAASLGNSQGCQIIVRLAARHPALVDKAVLQGPTCPSQGARLVAAVHPVASERALQSALARCCAGQLLFIRNGFEAAHHLVAGLKYDDEGALSVCPIEKLAAHSRSHPLASPESMRSTLTASAGPWLARCR
jgi:pimeloyl-ACP methyl ester carboxylesterase